MRVLIVDDHEPTLLAIASILDQEYPQINVVGIASSGDTAIRLAREAAPDVVVLDLDLDGEYGLDLLPAIDAGQGLAFVILTASDNPAERLRALAAGAVAFVSKCAPVAELIAAILAARTNALA
jgi:two-component system, NarL family, nitrate/nitrite response regulator NarL